MVDSDHIRFCFFAQCGTMPSLSSVVEESARMRVLISADMEGTCGVSSWVHVQLPEVTTPNQPASNVEYERFRSQMTSEVNAAIEGAFAGGATEVIVNDSHDFQRNILIEKLDVRAKCISGADKPLGMVQGVDQNIDVVMYTGYHAKAGTVGAPLAHTWNGWVQDVRISGVSTGEFGINAIIAGAYGAAVIMVAGDDQAVAQTRGFIGDQVTGAIVKWGISTSSAMHKAPTVAIDEIRDAAQHAMMIPYPKPYVIQPGTIVEIDADHQARIDQAMLIPGVQRAGNRTASFIVDNGKELNNLFRLVTKVGGLALNH